MLLLPLLLAPALPQASPPVIQPHGREVPTGTYTEAALGDFDGDLTPDLVYVDGDWNVVLAPALFSALLESGMPAVDVGIWPNYPTSAQDAIVTVGPAGGGGAGGASLHWWNAAQGQFNHMQLSTHADWVSATHVAVVGLGGSAAEVVGVVGNGTRVRTIRGGQDTLLFQSAVPLVDVAYFDSDGDAVPELACVGEDRVFVFEWNGTQWVSQQLNMLSSFEALGVSTGDSGGATEWLGWLGSTVSTALEHVTRLTASGFDAGDEVTGYNAVAVAAGDFVGSASSDLVVSWTDTQQLGVFQNLGGSDPFDATATNGFFTIDVSDTPTAANPNNEAEPVIGDADGDGDGDIFFLNQAQSELWVGINQTAEMTKPRLEPPPTTNLFPPTIYKKDASSCGPITDQLHLTFPVFHGSTLPNNNGVVANGVQAVLWEKPADPGDDFTVDFVPTAYTDPVAIGYLEIDTIQASGSDIVDFDLLQSDYETVGGAGGHTPDFLPSMYFILVRYYHKDGAGDITHFFAPLIVGMQAKGDPTIDPSCPGGTCPDVDANACEAKLTDYLGETVPPIKIWNGVEPACGQGTGYVLGTMKPLLTLPDLPPGQAPSGQL